jgi:sigma-B regulation protein RsbU (phosphoserine phosphatase)
MNSSSGRGTFASGQAPWLMAVGAAIVVYVGAAGIELAVINTIRPTEIELTWISDAILATAFGTAVYLWLHLRSSRRAFSRLEREHIVLDAQLSLAAQIQRGLLPSPPQPSAGVQWAARLEQSGKIGGDLYDFMRTPSHSVLILIGDVSGKGIPAALVLSSIRSLFRVLARDTSEPRDLVERLSESLYEDNRGTPYFTCLVARLDLDTRMLTYTNAGHPPGFVFDGATVHASVRRLDRGGPPAGMFPGQRYDSDSLTLGVDAAAVLVTDGITEALDEQGLSASSLVPEIVRSLPVLRTAETMCEALMARTAPDNLPPETDWQDDRTVVAFVLSDR